ncbi:hypothetical protein SJAV_12980 [Sulfurisphaera javensis]|uniref:Uncharacterized protein n=1 Tax=Sulfurisphaera javensis TaxID=2049879 RepID=A0AAT9GRB0_9CREN
MEITELQDIEVKKYIKFDGECITQIIDFKPELAIVNQACEIFNYFMNKGYKTRVKSPEILFLSLLYGSLNIKDILNKISTSQTKYMIKCCKNDLLTSVSNLDKELRVKLSSIAINSLDTLI